MEYKTYVVISIQRNLASEKLRVNSEMGSIYQTVK